MDDDLISRLPCDLLICILSRLTFKQAIATSVLSRRWEKLWTCYNGELGDVEFVEVQHENGCSSHMRMVNHVFENKFKPVEDDGILDYSAIQSSIEQKSRVSGTIDFSPYYMSFDFPPLRCYAQHRNQSLTCVRFHRVNVSDEIIEQFLYNCPLLQSLQVIESSKPLVHLRVSGETLALKHLSIVRCRYLTTIEISAPNLVSFHYFNYSTPNLKFDVRNVPNLVEVSIGNLTSKWAASSLGMCTSFSYLQELELRISSKGPDDSVELVELTSVKHLTMKFIGDGLMTVLEWTRLLKAFPALQKFSLHLLNRFRRELDGQTTKDEKILNKYLKVVEIVGSGWSNRDIEFVMRLTTKMVALEKVLLVTDNNSVGPMCYHGRVAETAVSIAAQLKPLVPKNINFVTIS